MDDDYWLVVRPRAFGKTVYAAWEPPTRRERIEDYLIRVKWGVIHLYRALFNLEGGGC